MRRPGGVKSVLLFSFLGKVLLSFSPGSPLSPSFRPIRTLGERVLSARCKLDVLVSAGAAICSATSLPLLRMKVGPGFRRSHRNPACELCFFLSLEFLVYATARQSAFSLLMRSISSVIVWMSLSNCFHSCHMRLQQPTQARAEVLLGIFDDRAGRLLRRGMGLAAKIMPRSNRNKRGHR